MAMRLAAELLWGAPWPHFQLDTSEAHQRHLGGITGDDPQMNHPEATNNQKTQMMVNQKLRIFFWGGFYINMLNMHIRCHIVNYVAS